MIHSRARLHRNLNEGGRVSITTAQISISDNLVTLSNSESEILKDREKCGRSSAARPISSSLLESVVLDGMLFKHGNIETDLKAERE